MTVLILASILALTNRFGSVAVDTHGARVVSYVPAGGSEVLEMLPSGYGGVPLCWPWFQFNGPRGKDSPKHGLARYRDFTLVSRVDGFRSSELVFRLESDERTRREFPHDFILTLTVRLAESLTLELAGKNTGTSPFRVTEAFHPYIRRDALAGLKDSGNGTFRTWDPDATSHLKTQGLASDDWRKFVCIENGTFAQDRAYVLRPGERHALVRSLHFPALAPARLVRIASSSDGALQPCWFYAPPEKAGSKVPLVVGLHTWSGDWGSVKSYRSALNEAVKRGWAMVGPDFRGPNSTPEACGSDLAVQDVVDAIEFAKSNANIDPARIYIIGGSGGGHMTLLMLGRHPDIFAAGAAFCPITDLARWHADSLLDHPGRVGKYARMLEASCGGTPAQKAEEYAKRSPLIWIGRVRSAGVPTYICTGIHDGWTGSVPVGHSIRAYNALADVKDRISEKDIQSIEESQRIPEELDGGDKKDAFYGQKMRIHLRRTSGTARLTIFEGGHGGNFPAGFDFLSRQVKARAVDWTIPSVGEVRGEQLEK